jgi:uncharacterized cupin superfamily protein
VWIASTTDAWTRPPDAKHASQVAGVGFLVTEGDTLAGKVVQCTTTPNVTEDFGDVALAFASAAPDIHQVSRSAAAVRVATTGDVDLESAPPATIDGVTVVDGDYVLVRAQTDPVENGVYRLANGLAEWVRASAWDESADFVSGVKVFVREGVLHQGSDWRLNVADAFVLDTNDVTWEQATGQLVYVSVPLKGDSAAGDQIDQYAVFCADRKMRLVRAFFFYTPGDVVESDTDYAGFDLARMGPDSDGVSCASQTTKTVAGGGGGSISASVAWDLVIDDTKRDLLPNNGLVFSRWKGNAGVQIPAGVLQLVLRVVGE